MRALEINRTLKKINLADNKFNDEDFLIDQIYRILEGILDKGRSIKRKSMKTSSNWTLNLTEFRKMRQEEFWMRLAKV